MRISVFSPLLLLLSIAMISCSVEKMVYRNGWYSYVSGKTDRLHHADLEELQAASPEISPGTNAVVRIDTSIRATTQPEVSLRKTIPEKFRSIISKRDTSRIKRGMTYPEALTSIHEKGGTVDRYAKTIHTLEIISYCMILLPPLFIPMVLTVIILSFLAENKILDRGGNCVHENLAIVQGARRNEVKLLCILGAIFLLFMGVFIYLTFFTNAFA
ncbi:MAG TPA: hypothetical protein VL651_11070 [Bacteroidia bacterium]|jgi:hypothetical protein|nr:hypothetical protein [Bacteroidia bacterium]